MVARLLFRTNTRRLREIVNIVAYFVGIVLLGSFLAPALYWAGRATAQYGVLTFLAETEFQKFFNRAMLVAAVVLLWPAVRSLKLQGWGDLGLERDPRAGQNLALGLGVAALCLIPMCISYVILDVYRWKKALPWEALPKLLLSSAVVAVLEETLFRGAIFGLFRRTMRPLGALFAVTTIFAVVHFLKPDERVVVSEVNWGSGFALLPHVFHQFTEPITLLAGFTTLFVLGWVLGYATLRTSSLWVAMGFHAGVVFLKMSFSKFTKRQAEYLPWIGDELQIGLVPVAVLAIGGALFWWRFRDVNLGPNKSVR